MINNMRISFSSDSDQRKKQEFFSLVDGSLLKK